MNKFATTIGWIVIILGSAGGIIYGLCCLTDYQREAAKIDIEARIERNKRCAKENQDFYNELGVCTVMAIHDWKGSTNYNSQCTINFRAHDGAAYSMYVRTEQYNPNALLKFKLQDRNNSKLPYIVPVEWKSPTQVKINIPTIGFCVYVGRNK